MEPSLLIGGLSARLNGVSDDPHCHTAGLLQVLAQVPDPRDPRGGVHPLPSLLAVAVSAVAAGQRSLSAISESAADLPMPVLERLQMTRDRFTGQAHLLAALDLHRSNPCRRSSLVCHVRSRRATGSNGTGLCGVLTAGGRTGRRHQRGFAVRCRRSVLNGRLQRRRRSARPTGRRTAIGSRRHSRRVALRSRGGAMNSYVGLALKTLPVGL